MRRYAIWLFVSVGLHAGLFFIWQTKNQPASLPLSSKKSVISLQLGGDQTKVPAKNNLTAAKTEEKPQTRRLKPIAQVSSKAPIKPKQYSKSTPTPNTQAQTKNKPSTQKKASGRASVSDTAQPAREVILTQAKLASSRTPKYPRRAIVRNQQGLVKVKLLVDVNGQAKNMTLLSSSGYRLLDNAVLRFVKQERFIPAYKNGQPIAALQVFSFRFVLKDE